MCKNFIIKTEGRTAADINKNRPMGLLGCQKRYGSVCFRAADGIFLKAEVVRPVTGLGEFKHNPVAVKGLAADNCQTIILGQAQIFFINLCDFLHSKSAFAVDNGDMQGVFEILINRPLCNFRGQIFDHILQKIVVIQNQWFSVQIVYAL